MKDTKECEKDCQEIRRNTVKPVYLHAIYFVNFMTNIQNLMLF